MVCKLFKAKVTWLPNVNLGVAWGARWELLLQIPAPHLSLQAACCVPDPELVQPSLLSLCATLSFILKALPIDLMLGLYLENGDTGKKVWQDWEGTSHLHIKTGFLEVVVS